ncbi:LysR family transcriptional regulator [Psychrobium sp. 1_MG-2023]|uniref:LysR family transcriptional regulator n=1 Tax=Psychrobium sp. 1_MG-2023 TaxID=3062624 RepID=UPI000C31C793|nr:LysR family transcriptional regulator [Psychrobium sp. 1_MG-2023]MDP2561400.1 LysR family transcriptional regulator [Psychrobium sp. 1_MG-2023]PKF54878.1 LysR family transcriptional regulator [Alteromonadales bacterium alter-6D02]
MQRKIDLVKTIRIFIAVVEEKSFSGASEKLNLATSAISKNVADLESYYDCKMLHRNTRSMHLTAEGERFIVEFKDILAQLDSLKMGLNHRKSTISGKLKITSPENAQGLGIDQKISDFMCLYPNIQVSWHQQNKQVNLVEEGVDVAIRIGRLEDSNLIVQTFSKVENLTVASPDYIEKYGIAKHPEELPNHKCIIEVSNRKPWRWRYIENNSEKTVAVSGELEVDKGEAVAFFAAQGHGVARLPSFMMRDYLDSGKLVPILQDFNTKPLDVSLVYPENRMSNPALSAFIEYIRS